MAPGFRIVASNVVASGSRSSVVWELGVGGGEEEEEEEEDVVLPLEVAESTDSSAPWCSKVDSARTELAEATGEEVSCCTRTKSSSLALRSRGSTVEVDEGLGSGRDATPLGGLGGAEAMRMDWR